VSVFNLSAESASTTVTLLRSFSCAALIAWPLSFTLPNALRGAGDVSFTMIVSILSMWLCRVVVSYILLKYFNMGVLGVWIGMFVDWYVRAFFYTARFISGKWLTKRAI
jgi:Na+-driven multidrug efflux pump